jgi:hypothetical protein
MSKSWGRLAAIGMLLVATACRDGSPVAPAAAAAPALEVAVSGNPSLYPVVVRTQPLSRDITVSAWVYPNNTAKQAVKIKDAGLAVQFPPGSVTSPVYVTLVAHAGKYVTYDFYPHGSTFAQPLKIQQDLHGTSAYHNEAVMSDLIGGYMDDGQDDLDQVTGLASLAETFTIFYWDDTDVFKKTTPSVAKFYTRHFSGYVLASGRSY